MYGKTLRVSRLVYGDSLLISYAGRRSLILHHTGTMRAVVLSLPRRRRRQLLNIAPVTRQVNTLADPTVRGSAHDKCQRK